jgi:hypothetical protein
MVAVMADCPHEQSAALLRQLASSKIQRNFNSERAAKPNDQNY